MPINIDVNLRRAEREDLDTIVEWMDDPDFHRFLYGEPTRSPKQIREQIVGMLGRTVGQMLPSAVYLIIDSDKHGPIGLMSLQNISWRNRSCNIDLYIGQKDRRGSLLAGLAFYRAMEYCFDELNLHRVAAFIYSFNTASWRIMERSGAKRELVLKEHVAREGKVYDMYGYGLLRAEFEELRKSLEGKAAGKSLAEMIEARRMTGREDAAAHEGATA